MKQLREIRKSKGLTLKQASENMGVSLPYLSEIERGVSSPTIKILIKVLDYYGYFLSIKPKYKVKIIPKYEK